MKDVEKFPKTPPVKEVKIKTNNGLDDCQIGLIQVIEKDLDKIMNRFGFTRTESTKSSDKLSFIYRQFGKAL